MSIEKIASRPPHADPTRRNVIILSISLALTMSGQAVIVATSALSAHLLTDQKALATLPIGLQWVGTMLATVPASLLMRRFGRRPIFIGGQIIGFLGGAIAAYAVVIQSFWLFAATGLLFGVHGSIMQYYRFAAADTASETFKSRAISYVMAGGIVAAILGPELAKLSRDLFSSAIFAGCFMAIAALCIVSILLLVFIDIPRPEQAKRGDSGRPLPVIVRNPVFVVAVFAALVGYASMTFVMTATPLAMVQYGHPFNDAATVIQWHILGMYAPSFFTGHLISRFGASRIIATGAAFLLLCVVINLSGVGMLQFWFGLIFLGLGWNFLFVGGTTLLTDTYDARERAKAQALNDFVIFTVVAVAAVSSGWVQHRFGWTAINLGVVLPVAAVIAAALWLGPRRRGAAPAE